MLWFSKVNHDTMLHEVGKNVGCNYFNLWSSLAGGLLVVAGGLVTYFPRRTLEYPLIVNTVIWSRISFRVCYDLWLTFINENVAMVGRLSMSG